MVAYFPYFEKIELRLQDHHPVCVALNPTNLLIPEQIFMKLDMHIIAHEPILAA
jgi:hypothetical protein